MSWRRKSNAELQEKLQSANTLLSFKCHHHTRTPRKSDRTIMVITYILLLQAGIGALVIVGLVMELPEWRFPVEKSHE